MPARIAEFCARDGPGRSPATTAAIVRCILESLALKHAETVELLARSPARRSTELHVVGGGARNELLCRWTAEAAGLPVLAGPAGGDARREPARAGDRARRARLARRGARGRSPLVRARRRTSPRELAALARGAGSASPSSPRRRRRWRCRRERVAGVLRGIPAPERPLGRGARRRASTSSTALDYRSNLLGSDRSLANQGGGNTSAKETVVDHAGRETRVLWVKGSGTDLATITPAGFPGLRLDELLPLRERERDGRRGDGRLPRCAARSAPTSRGRRSRRCCTRSCRRRTSTTRTRTP